jgi:ABC-type transporter Mla subunit MlaD
MDDALRDAVALFNGGRFTEFQDALETVAGATRAPSERQFYTSLDRLAEALHQLSVGDLEDAEALLGPALRKLDDFVPRFRGLNTEALREDFRRVVTELRDVRAGRKAEMELARLPRLRFLPE